MAESHAPGGDVTFTTEGEPVKAAGRFRTVLSQVLASTAKNMLLLDLGMTVSFPTIVIPKLRDSVGPLVLNDEQISWFGSIMYLCQPVGSVLSGIVLERLGRKKSMILVNFPHLIGWFIFYFANSAPLLYFSSVIMGLGVGFMEAPIITYVGEISQPEMRGILTSYSGTFVHLGFLFEYLLGAVLSDWQTAAAISAAVPIATVIAITQVPETPIWLLSRCRFEEAEKALCWLRGWVPPSAVKKEFDELVLYSENINKTKHAPQTSAENGVAHSTTTVTFRKGVFWRKIKELLKPQTRRPLALVLMFFFFQHCSGLTAMRPYMIQIFGEMELPVNPYWVNVLTAVFGLIGNVICMVGVRWWGKRPFSLISIAVASMASLLLGFYAYAVISPGKVATGGTSQNLSYVPLALFVVYVLMQSIGVLPIPWMILSEVFPFRSRGLASGIAAAGAYIMAFVASKTFLYVKSELHLHGAFWLYGGLGFVGFFAIYWTFAETEGRHLEDIEEFYKTGIRGKIPKRASAGEASLGLPMKFTSSVNSVRAENDKETSDEDMRVNKPNTNYSNDISGGIVGKSTETLQTMLTASVASLQDRESTTGDATEMNIDREIKHLSERKLEEAEIGKEKNNEMKTVEKEKSITTIDVKGNTSEAKEMGDQSKEAKAVVENNVDVQSDVCVKENVVVHKEGGVEERTSM